MWGKQQGLWFGDASIYIFKACDYKDTSMGNEQEFKEVVAFDARYHITPVVSGVFDGLEMVEDAFSLLRASRQIGKVVRVAGRETKL